MLNDEPKLAPEGQAQQLRDKTRPTMILRGLPTNSWCVQEQPLLCEVNL